MINPAAVTLLVGIFTFREVMVFGSGLPAEAIAMAGTDCLFLQKTACKCISKNQSEPLNGKIFAAYQFFGGDKL